MRRARELTKKEKYLFERLRQWLENTIPPEVGHIQCGLRVFFQDVPIDDIRVVEGCEGED